MDSRGPSGRPSDRPRQADLREGELYVHLDIDVGGPRRRPRPPLPAARRPEPHARQRHLAVVRRVLDLVSPT